MAHFVHALAKKVQPATAKRAGAPLAPARAPKRARTDNVATTEGRDQAMDAADPIEEVPIEEEKEADKVYVSKHYRRMDGTPASTHKNIPVESDVIRYLYARFSEAWRTRVPFVHPHDARIRFDDSPDPATGARKHDYYIDEKLCRGLSVTGLKEQLFPRFNAGKQAFFSARKGAEPGNKGKYAGKTDAQIRGMWKKTSEDGTEKHAFFEHFLTPEPMFDDNGKPVLDATGAPLLANPVLDADGALIPTDAPIPHGFFRFLLDHPELDIVRTEWLLLDPDTSLRGSADLVAQNRITGAYILIDWKNCNGEFDKPTKETGSHFLTRALPNNKLGAFTIQFNAYREIIERHYDLRIAQMVCVNFDPARLNYYALYDVPRFHMAHIFALLPWDCHALAHLPPDPAGRPFLVEPLRDDDVRGEGPTRIARVMAGPLPLGYIWTGHAHKTKEQPLLDDAGKQVIRADGTPMFKFNANKYDLPDSEWRPAEKSFALKTSMMYKAYEAELLRDRARLERLVPELFGKTLLCWCGRKPDGTPEETCHNDVLAKYANALGSGALVLPPPHPSPAINWDADNDDKEEKKEEEEIIVIDT